MGVRFVLSLLSDSEYLTANTTGQSTGLLANTNVLKAVALLFHLLLIISTLQTHL